MTDKERLLTDVLGAEADAGFRANVLAESLRAARRRRRFRHLRQSGVALAALLAVALCTSHFLRRNVKPASVHAPPPLSYRLVVTQPLVSGQIVGSQALAPDQCVASTSAATLVRTTTGGFGEIGDDELMALAAPQVVALVRRGAHEAELVFVPSSPEDSSLRQN